MKLKSLLVLAIPAAVIAGAAYAQTFFNAPPLIGLVSSTGGSPYSALATTGTDGPTYDNAQAMLLLGLGTDGKYHVCGTANPCTGGGGGGGGGGTIPSTLDLLAGDNAGNAADAGFLPADVGRLSTTQTFTGAKTFSAFLAATASTATNGTSTATFTVTDNEADQAVQTGANILFPNLAASHVAQIQFGHDTGTRNGLNIQFQYGANGIIQNNARFGIIGNTTPNMTMFGSGNISVNTLTDAGFNFNVAGSLRATIPGTSLGTALASATTIAPTSGLQHVTGTAAIATITPPTVGFIGCLTFIADGAWTTTTAGNIQATMTAVAGTPYQGCWDGTKWFIK